MTEEVQDKHTWLAQNFIPKNTGEPRRKNLASIQFQTVTSSICSKFQINVQEPRT